MRDTITNKPKKNRLVRIRTIIFYSFGTRVANKVTTSKYINYVTNYLFHHYTNHCWTVGANEGQKHLR